MGKKRKKLTDEQINKFRGTDLKAEKWFMEKFYGNRDNMHCPRCGSTRGKDNPTRKLMPYYCRDCRRFFSIKTGTVMERYKVPLRKWAQNLYKQVYHLRGKLARATENELGVAKNTARAEVKTLRRMGKPRNVPLGIMQVRLTLCRTTAFPGRKEID